MRLLLAFVTLFLADVAAGETRVFTGQSDEDVALNVTFNGQEILIYGAVQSDDDEDFDVAIVVEGPPQDVIVTRKEKRFGFWLNLSAEPFLNVPSYSAVLSSSSMHEIVDWDDRIKNRIGIRSKIDSNWTQLDERAFLEGLIRHKARIGQYVVNESGVKIQGGVLFSGRIPLPASLIDGQFNVEIYVFKDKEIVARSSSKISVYKSGLDAWIYELAKNWGLLYGLLTIALATIAALLSKMFVDLFRR